MKEGLKESGIKEMHTWCKTGVRLALQKRDGRRKRERVVSIAPFRQQQ